MRQINGSTKLQIKAGWASSVRLKIGRKPNLRERKRVKYKESKS
jgi:hypothetical protein